jgi:hypothetical protein
MTPLEECDQFSESMRRESHDPRFSWMHPRSFAFWRREIIEHPESISVRICRSEFVQSIRLRFRIGQKNGFGRAPGAVQIIDLTFAVQIEPDQNGAAVAAFFAECGSGEKEPTPIARDSR